MIRPALFALLILSTFAIAQEKKADTKAKKTPFDNEPGYKVHQLAGFTVVIQDDVLNADTSKLKRKPVECIELELKNITGLLNQKAIDTLRKVPIWAEWDEPIVMSNGRQGQAYATYYGGHQVNMLARGMNPLKAKCVVLHLTKALTKSYQDKDRPETLVLLHELAHAVHDQMLNFQNPDVKAAYQQAMSRKLYDKSLYIATNDAEFFAEASCAFLDRLDYVPKNRAALKDHDPETYKLMEKIWGKSATVSLEATKGKRPANGSGEFDMDITPADVKWTRAILGEAFKLTKGKVILLAYVHSEQGAVLNRLRAWHEEFEPYGLCVVVANAEYNRDPAESAAAYKKLNLPFGIHDATFIPLKNSDKGRAEKPGHGVLFVANGKCEFRGPVDDATIYLKEAIGRLLYEKLELSEGSVPKQLQPAYDALRNGDSLVSVVTKAQNFANSSDAPLAEAAKKLIAVIMEPANKSLADAVAMKKSKPLEAYLQAEKLVARYKGTAVGSKAATLVGDLLTAKEVQAEMKARKDFEAVKRLETTLSGQPGAFEPKDRSFQAKHANMLKQLKDAIEVMKKKHPSARATEQALAIGKEYGVE